MMKTQGVFERIEAWRVAIDRPSSIPAKGAVKDERARDIIYSQIIICC